MSTQIEGREMLPGDASGKETRIDGETKTLIPEITQTGQQY